MTYLELMQTDMPYHGMDREMPKDRQAIAKELCWRFDRTSPSQTEERAAILKELFGTCHPLTFIEPTFHCDYGFNIHTHGLAVINYNCTILDTSPVHIGANAFLAPGVCLSCVGHAFLPDQRAAGLCTSSPITLEDDVWIGANATVCGGVTIGRGSIIGAGSVVTHDIPAGVVAAGVPCRVLRPVTEDDRIQPSL